MSFYIRWEQNTYHDDAYLNALIQRKHRKTKNEFSERNRRKRRPTSSRIKQNNDHTRIVRKYGFVAPLNKSCHNS